MAVFINNIIFGNESFPNFEGIYKSIDLQDNKNIEVKIIFEDDRDITRLIMAKGWLDETLPKTASVSLFMPYVPYSRMDRKIKGYCFTLKHFCNFINSLNFDRVKIYDPHSIITTALINRVEEISLQPGLEKIISCENPDYIFYPDNGAVKKYSEIFNLSMPVFFGNKKRDLSTGKILKYELVNAPDISGKTILIIDDICVGGRTFAEAGSALKEAGAARVVLYVTHLEKAIEKGELLKTDYVDKIYTLDTMQNKIDHSKITIL